MQAIPFSYNLEVATFQLTEEQQEFCTIISMGCDHETARKYLGWSTVRLRREIRQATCFAKHLARAEATAELSHVQNLRNAARDEKHWRASVWWLERRAPERYGRRTPDALSVDQIQQIIELLADVIVDVVSCSAEREKILAKFAEVASGVHGNESAYSQDEVEESECE